MAIVGYIIGIGIGIGIGMGMAHIMGIGTQYGAGCGLGGCFCGGLGISGFLPRIGSLTAGHAAGLHSGGGAHGPHRTVMHTAGP